MRGSLVDMLPDPVSPLPYLAGAAAMGTGFVISLIWVARDAPATRATVTGAGTSV